MGVAETNRFDYYGLYRSLKRKIYTKAPHCLINGIAHADYIREMNRRKVRGEKPDIIFNIFMELDQGVHGLWQMSLVLAIRWKEMDGM